MDRQPGLTAKQQRIYDYLRRTILEKGFPPSVREICAEVGLSSSSTVHAHLSALEGKGYIHRDPSKPRAIEISDQSFMPRQEMISLPVIGTVAAGQPLLAEQNVDEYVSFPAGVLHSSCDKGIFMLKVKGSSMINAGIYDKDKIIVEQCDTAGNGEIVVALVDDSATVKRFYKEAGRYRLQPENDEMEPIIVDHVQILGRVIGLLRFMG